MSTARIGCCGMTNTMCSCHAHADIMSMVRIHTMYQFGTPLLPPIAGAYTPVLLLRRSLYTKWWRRAVEIMDLGRRHRAGALILASSRPSGTRSSPGLRPLHAFLARESLRPASYSCPHGFCPLSCSLGLTRSRARPQGAGQASHRRGSSYSSSSARLRAHRWRRGRLAADRTMDADRGDRPLVGCRDW